MTRKEKTNMAILVVKCLRASWASPQPTDPLVKKWGRILGWKNQLKQEAK